MLAIGRIHGEDFVVDGDAGGGVAFVVAALEVAAAEAGSVFLEPSVASGSS